MPPRLPTLLLGLCLTLPACASLPGAGGHTLTLTTQQIAPHLQRHFPLQLQPVAGQPGVRLTRPRLSLADSRAVLQVDVALGDARSAFPLGRATFSSGLRLDAAQGAVFLDRPRLVSMAQPDGTTWQPDATLSEILGSALDRQARQTPVYRLDAGQRQALDRVAGITLDRDRVVIQLR